MKNFFYILIAISFVSITNAQWTSQTSGTTELLSGVSFTDANNGTVVGGSGTILRTTDGGTTWVIQTSGTTEALFAVSFTDANNGIAVGVSGTILRTTDGGTTWVIQTSGTTNTLLGVYFTDVNTGTAVGSAGTILRYSGNVTAIEDSKTISPTKFILMQNYPNPFNPSTTIQYTISSEQFVTLKIYDLLGKEVATLVNERKSIGSYRINFDGSRLTSGVYFYRLQVYTPGRAGSFTQTKKFVLLR
ncbi:MAG: T9SS type A sorting domain-containing protein [Bacteroidetes bacterium]|nr:T9SS type A sorting domain-containing protein [Bacteroidota bacterium]